MTRIIAATRPGVGSHNQDRYLIGPRYAAVFDGATDFALDGDPGRVRDGGWYAQVLSQAIQHHLDTGPHQALAKVVETALTDMVNQLNLSAENCPSSTISLARWDEEQIELYLLGDSGVLLQGVDGSTNYYSDTRLSAIGPEQRDAYKNHIAGGGGYTEAHKANLIALQAAQRQARNTDGGYWIASADPQAARHGITHHLDIANVSALALMSDGASSSVLTYHQPDTWAAFLTQACRDPDALLTEIHHTETTDPTGVRWPRSKPHDDKTLVIAHRDGSKPPAQRPGNHAPNAHSR